MDWKLVSHSLSSLEFGRICIAIIHGAPISYVRRGLMEHTLASFFKDHSSELFNPGRAGKGALLWPLTCQQKIKIDVLSLEAW
jgi:hypothetical protein